LLYALVTLRISKKVKGEGSKDDALDGFRKFDEVNKGK